MNKNILVGILITTALLPFSCNHDRQQISDKQWHDERERLAQLDKAIGLMQPDVVATIDSGMRHAGDSLEYYTYFGRMANYYSLTATPDSMLPYIEQTLDYCRRHPSTRRSRSVEAMALENKANYYQHFRQQLDTVITLRLQAYHALLDSDLPDLLPNLCGNMADVYALLGQLPEAAVWYRRAIYLADSMQVGATITATLQMGLGRIYQTLQDYERAAQYYETASRHFDSMTPNMQAYYLNNYGNYLYYKHDYQGALDQFLQLKRLLEDNGAATGFDMYLCKINLADVYLNLGQTGLARQYVDQAEPFFAAVGVTDGVYYAHSIRIALAVSEHRLSDVPALLASENFPPPTEQGLVDIRNKYLRQYYLATGNAAAAFTNLNEETTRNDSLGQRRAYMRVTEAMMRLSEDTLRWRHAFEMEHEKANVRTANTWVAILVALVLLLLLLIVTWIYRTRRRRMQTEMDFMRLRLASMRNRISPHFVFNVLSRHLSHVSKNEEEDLMKLVKLIRANLDLARNTLISLHEELEFVRYYVDVECGQDIDFRIEAPADEVLNGILLPAMSVQILVENAIKHGLKGTERQPQLTISVETTPEETRISVADNGRGFDIRAVTASSTGTGLSILRQTIAIFNERNHRHPMDFTIGNGPDGHGCTARLVIPHNIKTLA